MRRDDLAVQPELSPDKGLVMGSASGMIAAGEPRTADEVLTGSRIVHLFTGGQS